jgi:hypothetical protein
VVAAPGTDGAAAVSGLDALLTGMALAMTVLLAILAMRDGGATVQGCALATVVRSKGDALFCDWRYDHAFANHNAAESHGAGCCGR